MICNKKTHSNANLYSILFSSRSFPFLKNIWNYSMRLKILKWRKFKDKSIPPQFETGKLSTDQILQNKLRITCIKDFDKMQLRSMNEYYFCVLWIKIPTTYYTTEGARIKRILFEYFNWQIKKVILKVNIPLYTVPRDKESCETLAWGCVIRKWQYSLRV